MATLLETQEILEDAQAMLRYFGSFKHYVLHRICKFFHKSKLQINALSLNTLELLNGMTYSSVRWYWGDVETSRVTLKIIFHQTKNDFCFLSEFVFICIIHDRFCYIFWLQCGIQFHFGIKNHKQYNLCDEHKSQGVDRIHPQSYFA